MRFVTYLFFFVYISTTLPTTASENAPPFQEASIESPTLTLYYAPWCYYCQKVINYLKRINKQVPLKDVQNPENKQL